VRSTRARRVPRSGIPRSTVAALGALLVMGCSPHLARLNARHNAQQATREADRLVRHGLEDSARTVYARAASAAQTVLGSEALTSSERVRWQFIGGRAAAWAGQCDEATSLLPYVLRQPDLSPLDELDGRIALAACALSGGAVRDGVEQLRTFETARLLGLPADRAESARRRLALWTMRLLLLAHDDATVDSLWTAFGPAPRPWEPEAALYGTVRRERSVGPMVARVRGAREPADALAAIAMLDTASVVSARLARLRAGTDRLQLLLATDDGSGAAAYHAGLVALDWIGNPALALTIWCEAAQVYRDSPLAPLLLWRVASSSHDPVRARDARDALLTQFERSPESALLRGETSTTDPQEERERAELLRARWELMERALAEQRAARAPVER